MAPEQWASRPDQLAALISTDTKGSRVIADPTGRPADPNRLAILVCPAEWATDIPALREALRFTGASKPVIPDQNVLGVVAPVGDRLVYTVEEAATLLGLSRSFAYEAVQRGDIPSMRIGKRILVPKGALERWLTNVADSSANVDGENLEADSAP